MIVEVSPLVVAVPFSYGYGALEGAYVLTLDEAAGEYELQVSGLAFVETCGPLELTADGASGNDSTYVYVGTEDAWSWLSVTTTALEEGAKFATT